MGLLFLFSVVQHTYLISFSLMDYTAPNAAQKSKMRSYNKNDRDELLTQVNAEDTRIDRGLQCWEQTSKTCLSLKMALQLQPLSGPIISKLQASYIWPGPKSTISLDLEVSYSYILNYTDIKEHR